MYLCYRRNVIMSKQKNIMNFFKPVVSNKRCSSDDSTCDEKKRKMSLTEDEEGKSKSKLRTLCQELSVLDPNMGASWFNVLEPEFNKPYFKKLSNFLEVERAKFTIHPSFENVWSWSKLCSVQSVKVVILGQDPYHNPHQAHGLCFSVPRGVSPPPSLLNMYKELKTDIEGFVTPPHGDLTGWAKQGVLLLNACLTVCQNSPNSHVDQGWEKITDAVIKHISTQRRDIVFLLWGSFAQKKANCVDQKKHHLLKAVHPSPLSAHRGFFGCKHFSKCNKLLEEAGKEPIDWTRL